MLAANTIIAKHGNLKELKSDVTFRKIRSESLSSLDREKNELWDLILMQKKNSEYIKEISVPFCIKTYNLEQINILEHEINSNVLPLIYFDATGNIVKNLTNDGKRVY